MAEQFFVTEQITRPGPVPIKDSVLFEYGVDNVQECNAEMVLCVCKGVGAAAALDEVAADPRVLAIPRSNLKRRVDNLPPNAVANAQFWLTSHGLTTQIAEHATLRQAVNALGQELTGAGFDLSKLGIIGGSPTRARATRRNR